jgi:hypothetical protein
MRIWPRTLFLLLFASLPIVAYATTGKLTKREAIPRPPTDSNGCMLDNIFGSPSYGYQLERRAKKEAIDEWKKQVKRRAPPEFTSWKHANSYTKEMKCEKSRGKFSCRAKATPCEKSTGDDD